MVADLGPGPRRTDKLEPIFARMLMRRRQDLDDVAIAELVAQRLYFAVDARARDTIAQLGMDLVRKVDGGGAAREDAHVPLRREDVDLVLKEIDFDALEKLGGILELLLPLE